MRVISGQAKGRALKAVPGKGTRPTTDKVKEAIFSMVGPYFAGGTALDLFAGTGGLGIEALSRGMERAIFVDIERESVEVIRHNLHAAGLAEQAEVYRNDAFKALKALAKRDLRFQAVFLDPPYKLKKIEELLQTMEEYRLFEENAFAVVEYDASHTYAETVGSWHKERHAVYGDTAILIYRYKNGGSDTNGTT
jgi:16S rRNA (guanine966-N2)-methyltransferase